MQEVSNLKLFAIVSYVTDTSTLVFYINYIHNTTNLIFQSLMEERTLFLCLLEHLDQG